MAILQKNNKIKKSEIEIFRGQLLEWYDSHARDIPWRVKNGAAPDPYKIWLSEIMCQQTTVAAVIPYHQKFLTLWPTVHDLAKAPQEDIMREWAGLGYYARARNLHACAKIISAEYNGQFPNTQAELIKLPGIGDYTSAAITTIAFNTPATVVDGNVERVLARYFAQTKPLKDIKKELKTLAAHFFDECHNRAGDLAQAFMDLGAGICTPKNPKCDLCPIHKHCQSRIKGITDQIPAKPVKTAKPQKTGYVYWLETPQGQVLLERRPEKAMLGGMMAFPTSEWVEQGKRAEHILGINTGNIQKFPPIRHSFTHFDLKLIPVKQNLTARNNEYLPHNIRTLETIGFPTLFEKARKTFSQVE